MSHRVIRHMAAALLAIATPWSAQAIDGATRINQFAATQGRVTASDGRGFPVEIDRPGRFVLTSNLEVPDVNTTAIELSAPGVSIDLNGFEISCPTCTGSGTGHGIVALAGATDASVRNGTVRGFGAEGIELSEYRSRVVGVRAIANGGSGIQVGESGRVEGSIAARNGLDGIRAGAHSNIMRSISNGNGRHGVTANMGSTIHGNIATDNDSDGVLGDIGSTVTANVAARNLRDGISADESAVTHNNSIQHATGAGIRANKSSVIGNVVVGNDKGLLSFDQATGYSQNVLTGNNAFGPQVGVEAIQLDKNLCSDDTICP